MLGVWLNSILQLALLSFRISPTLPSSTRNNPTQANKHHLLKHLTLGCGSCLCFLFFIPPSSSCNTCRPHRHFLTTCFFFPDASSVQSLRQLCLLESPDLRLVKQRVRQPKPTLLLLPLLTSRPPLPTLPQPHASEKGSLPRRVPATPYHLGLQVDGPRDKRSPKPLLHPPSITPTNPHPDQGERENPPQKWTAQSKFQYCLALPHHLETVY